MSPPRKVLRCRAKNGAHTYKRMCAPPTLAQARQGRCRLVAHGGSRGEAAVVISSAPTCRGDRVAYRRRLFMSPLPGLVSCTASSSHGYRHGPHFPAATRLASGPFTSAWCALASRMRARGWRRHCFPMSPPRRLFCCPYQKRGAYIQDHACGTRDCGRASIRLS